MKKFLMTVALVLTTTMLFSACSCAGCNTESKITGYSYWHKGKTYSSTFSETATYKVTYKDDYKVTTGGVTYDYTKTNQPANVKSTYGEGSYVVTVNAIAKNELPDVAQNSDTSVTEFYKLTTNLTLPVSYEFNSGSKYDFVDNTVSEVYFESMGTSLRPLYSKKVYDTTYFSNNETILRSAYTTEIKWADKAELTITDNSTEKTEYAVKENEYGFTPVENDTFKVKYTKGCVLDNEQLLFAIRAFTLSSEFNSTVKVFDTAYKNQLTSISIKSSEPAPVTDVWTLNLNGTEEQKTSTSTFLTTVVRNNTKLSGSPLICYYQIIKYDGEEEGVVADESGRSRLIKMVTRLPFNAGSYGALDYTLTSVVVND